MNKKPLSIPKILFLSCISASAVAVIFRMILTATLIEPKKHALYKAGSIMPDVFHIFLLLVTVAAICVSLFMTPKKTDAFTLRSGTPMQVTGFILGILYFVDAIAVFFIIMDASSARPIFEILELAFALASSIFFMGTTFKPQLKSLGISLTSLFPVAWFAICLIRIYFDNDLLMTDPGRILRQIAFLAAMVACLCEPRERLGIFNHRFFLAASTAAPVILLASAVPEIVYSKKLMLGTSDSTVRSLICIVIAFHLISKLHTYQATCTNELPEANTDSTASAATDIKEI